MVAYLMEARILSSLHTPQRRGQRRSSEVGARSGAGEEKKVEAHVITEPLNFWRATSREDVVHLLVLVLFLSKQFCS